MVPYYALAVLGEPDEWSGSLVCPRLREIEIFLNGKDDHRTDTIFNVLLTLRSKRKATSHPIELVTYKSQKHDWNDRWTPWAQMEHASRIEMLLGHAVVSSRK